MEDLFSKKKGTVICNVKVNTPSVERVSWETEDGKKMLEELKIATQGSKKSINLSLDITYDEWNTGIKRFCIVEHSALLDQVKKAYERKIGKKTTIIY